MMLSHETVYSSLISCVCSLRAVIRRYAHSPGRLIEEHDGRVVDELQGYGKPFLLSSGEVGCADASAFQQAQHVKDVLDLQIKL